jgi:hypothetical protein
MNDVIDRLGDLSFDVFDRGMRVTPNDEIGKSTQCTFRRISVNGRE